MTDKVSQRLSAKDFADRAIPGGRVAYLEKQRALVPQPTFDQIAEHLAETYGVVVTGEAVRLWCRDGGVA